VVNIQDQRVRNAEKGTGKPTVRVLVRGVFYDISGEIEPADRSVGIETDTFNPTEARPIDEGAANFPWESLTDAEIRAIDLAFWAAQPLEQCDPIDEEKELGQGISR
jgi:hypothetical protein